MSLMADFAVMYKEHIFQQYSYKVVVLYISQLHAKGLFMLKKRNRSQAKAPNPQVNTRILMATRLMRESI